MAGALADVPFHVQASATQSLDRVMKVLDRQHFVLVTMDHQDGRLGLDFVGQ